MKYNVVLFASFNIFQTYKAHRMVASRQFITTS